MNVAASLRIGLLCTVALCVLSAAPVYAVDEIPKNETEVASLEKVASYLVGRHKRTSLQNASEEKELLNKVFQGTVEVSDVKAEGDKVVIVCPADPTSRLAWGEHEEIQVLVDSAELKDKVAKVKPDDQVQLTAKLTRFWKRDSGYSNVIDTYIAEFSNIQSLKLKPKKINGQEGDSRKSRKPRLGSP